MYKGPALNSLMIDCQLKTIVKWAKSKIGVTCTVFQQIVFAEKVGSWSVASIQIINAYKKATD